MRRTSKYLIVLGILFLAIHIIRLLGYLGLPYFEVVYRLFNITRFDIMLLGAAGAVMVYNKLKILKILYRVEIQVFAWFLLIQSYIYGPVHVFSFFDYQFNALIYLIIIINLATNKKSLIKLNHGLFNFFGKISYGIYVYHILVIFLLGYIFNKSEIAIPYFLFALFIISITILVSYVSFNYFEKPILLIKNKFAIVKSSA